MRRLFFSLAFMLAVVCVVRAQAHENLDKRKVALQGYDPVAYFTTKEPAKGKANFSQAHKGAVYYFSSQENMELFKKDPSQYAPQYGGWCAYAIGKAGKKIRINPKSFKVKDNKLYLFYKKGTYDALDGWNEQEEQLRSAADTNWREIIAKKATKKKK